MIISRLKQNHKLVIFGYIFFLCNKGKKTVHISFTLDMGYSSEIYVVL
jgi:hypothetical protein